MAALLTVDEALAASCAHHRLSEPGTSVVVVVLNGLAAMWIVPSWAIIFKPAFITKLSIDEDGVLHQVANNKETVVSPA